MTTAGLIDTSSQIRQLSTIATEHLKSPYYEVKDFGFLRLTSNEQYAQTWYPTPSDIVPAGWYTLDIHGASFGDYNGDGLVDVLLQPMLHPHVVPHQTPITPLILLQDGNGGFKNPQEITNASNFPDRHFLYRIASADFNKDGRTDAAISAMLSVNRNADGNQGYHQSPVVVFGSETSKFSWIDSYSNFAVQDLPNKIKGYTSGHSIAVGDFDGDSYPDWFSNWYLFYNDQSGGFRSEVLLPNGAAQINSPTGYHGSQYDDQWWWPTVNSSVSSDFDEDGFNDLIYSTMPNSDPSMNGGDLIMVRGSKSGLLDGSKVIVIPRSNDIPGNIGTNFMVSMDINGDGHADLIFMEHYWTTDAGDSTYYYSKAKLRTFLGDGKGNLTESTGTIIDPYAGHRHGEGNIHVVDLNGDGWKDLVLTGYQVNLKDVWASGSSDFDYSTVFLNDHGILRYVDPSNLAYVQPYQFAGDETLKPWVTGGVGKLIPVDISNDGMVDFVGLVQTQLHQWPQVEQQYTYSYIAKATAPLARNQSNESLTGTKGSDKIYGFDGDDQIRGDAGNDNIDGGSGTDTAVYSGSRSNYTVTKAGSIYTVVDKTGADGTDTHTNIERLKFSDTFVAIDLDGNAGKVAKLLGAVFGKDALTNKEYVGIGLNLLDGWVGYQNLAALAVSAVKKTSSTDICTLLWTNVFGKAPTDADIAPYKAMLDSGQISVGAFTALAADTSLNTTNIDLVGLSKTGIEYT